MSKKDDSKKMKRFTDEEQRDNTRLARLQYDPDLVNESVKRWDSYGKDGQERIMAEGDAIYSELAEALKAGTPANDPDVQDILVRWHNHIRHFYEPTIDILRGLGELYNTSPDFMATFERFDDRLPAYLQEAIAEYVDVLETAELERMLAEEEEQHAKRMSRLSRDD